MKNKIAIYVKCSGELREYFKDEARYCVDTGITLQELKKVLSLPDYPITAVVNDRVARSNYELADQDRVTFIISVGGG